MTRRRRASALLLGALLLESAAGAGAVAAPRTTPRIEVATPTTPHRTAASNKAAATTEAATLLALTPTSLPAGATALTAQPSRLAGSSPLGTPSATSLVLQSAFWSVPVSATTTLAYLKTHAPRGLTPFETGSSSMGAVTINGLSWSAADSTAWQSAWLEFGVTSDGAGGSLVRADALVVWLDPTPYKDTAHGKRIHISVGTDCPKVVTAVGVHNSGNDLRSSLVPTTNPTAGLVCSYGANRQRKAHHSLDTPAARKVAKTARALPLAHADGAVTACPADFGTFAIVVLRFPHRPDVDLWLDPAGCSYVANGLIVTGAGSLASVAGIPRSAPA